LENFNINSYDTERLEAKRIKHLEQNVIRH